MSKLILNFIGCLLLLTAIGCRPQARDVKILIAGDTHGWITPCGCAANQSGGLARRATVVRGADSYGDVLLLDAGGSALGTSPYQQFKLKSLLHGLNKMGLAAHNIGGSETELSPSDLVKLGKATGVIWLSSNLTDRSGDTAGLRVLQIQRAGIKIAVAGVIDPALVIHSDWQAADPKRAVLKAFDGIQADVRIVLAYLDESGLRRLAEALPEVDYIVGGPTGQTMSPTRIGPVTIISATNKGKFLAQLKLASRPNSFIELKAEITEVKSDLHENHEQLVNLETYYTALAGKDYTAQEAGLVSDLSNAKKGYAIAGTATCVHCHQPDDSIWEHSKHAHAWNVLVAKNAQFDPQCQQCHTTGYGQAGGFENVAHSSKLVHVGCENCHGPSQAHVLDPRKRTPFQAKEQCIRCHDHENSPQFNLDAYWVKVFHAGKKATQ